MIATRRAEFKHRVVATTTKWRQPLEHDVHSFEGRTKYEATLELSEEVAGRHK
jgi:hypothetical protein